MVRSALAEAFLHAEQWPEAIRLLKRNLAILERIRGSEDPITSIARNNLAQAQRSAAWAGGGRRRGSEPT